MVYSWLLILQHNYANYARRELNNPQQPEGVSLNSIIINYTAGLSFDEADDTRDHFAAHHRTDGRNAGTPCRRR